MSFAGAALLAASCAPDVVAGYSGPYPSAAAQRALQAIVGRSLPPESLGTLGERGVVLEIESFAVVPNPVTGKGPVMRLCESGRATVPPAADPAQGHDGVWYLPVLTDGDAADLVRRATGSVPLDFGGSTSAAYRAVLAPDDPAPAPDDS
jgi:hypothetical protein